MIDNRNIGAVAAEILARPDGHKGNTYILTGNEQPNHEQIAGVFSKVLGRKVMYQPITDADAKTGLLLWKMPEPIADAVIEAFGSMREGHLSRPPVTTDVKRILGSKPVSFEQFVRDHASMYKG